MARPRLPEDEVKHSFSVSTTRPFWEQVRRAARDDHVSVSDWVVQAIKDRMVREEVERRVRREIDPRARTTNRRAA